MVATKETMSIPEAARRLGVTLKYVYDLVQAERISAAKVNRKWRIDAAELEEFAKRREVAAR